MKFLFDNLKLKVTALVIAVVLWLLVTRGAAPS